MVFRYGLLAPTENDDLVREQLRLAGKYRNTLIEIERGRRAALREVLSAHGDVATMERAVGEAERAEVAAASALSKERSATRSRSETAEQKAALKDARAATKVAKRALFDYRRVVREDPAIIAAQDTINERAHELSLSARAHCGVYWGTYLLIEAEHQSACKVPLYDGAEPNDPRFSRFTGEGSIGVQIHGGMDAADVLGANMWLRVDPVDECAWHAESRGERRRASRTMLRVRVGSNGRAPIWAAWPMVMHRSLPVGGVVKCAAVHVRRIGPREEWWATITVNTDSTVRPTSHADGAVAVDLGWRQFGDEIRVAAWRGDDGEAGELRLHADDVRAMRKADELRSTRDDNFNAARDTLVTWLKDREVPEWLTLATTTLPQWRSAGRLAALVKRWALTRFDGDEEMFGRRPTKNEIAAGENGVGLEGWRYHDYHLWTWETSQRTGSIRRRTDIYRVFAARLADRYATLVVEDFDLRDIAKRPGVGAERENETARSNRQLAAVSDLRTSLKNAFSSRGGTTEKIPAEGTTITCHVCGLIEKFDAAAYITHACSGCGSVWDQDDNACVVLLARWKRERSRGAQGPGTARGDENVNSSDGVKESKWKRAARMKAEKDARRGTARKTLDNASG